MQRRRFLKLSVAGVLAGCGGGSTYVARLPEPLSSTRFHLTPLLPSIPGNAYSASALSDTGWVVGVERAPVSRGRLSPAWPLAQQLLVRIAPSGEHTVLLAPREPLPLFGMIRSTIGASAISRDGSVLGWNTQQLVLWDSKGIAQLLNVPSSNLDSLPPLRTDEGTIYYVSTNYSLLYRLTVGGTPEYIPTTLGSMVERTVVALANNETFAGFGGPLGEYQRPWRLYQGKEEFLPLPPGTYDGRLSAIQENGDSVGVAGGLPLRYHGTQPVLLPLPPEFDRGWANGCNADTTVGTAYPSSLPGTTRALLWEGSSPVFLDSLFPDDSGWTFTSAQAINRLGQILATGRFDGNEYSVLLTPRIVGAPPT
ncbi:hypothetical protein [Armatimonas rosea]|uniref:Twin-arginine translocation signal domain-containing protein n=1 Tax=Armatimonas rosea TaxID=685828 RepID=A0A7W9STT9_ARMRO|nr:hypothetical protein [Armatimonas rosea]MBB6052285.1 hypothetical protein [Armatimonas rosea]